MGSSGAARRNCQLRGPVPGSGLPAVPTAQGALGEFPVQQGTRRAAVRCGACGWVIPGCTVWGESGGT